MEKENPSRYTTTVAKREAISHPSLGKDLRNRGHQDAQNAQKRGNPLEKDPQKAGHQRPKIYLAHPAKT
jgi:hypothetical protein